MTDEPTVPANYAATLFDLSGRVAVVTGGGSWGSPSSWPT
jgi:hypothetical protein